jgi:hypothetical protein
MSERGFQETGRDAHVTGDAAEAVPRASAARSSGASLPALPGKRELSLEAVMDLARAILRPASSDGFAARAQDDTWGKR